MSDNNPVVPPPGSDAAVAQGCLCPVMDNEHGKGYRIILGWPAYVVNADCPLHGSAAHTTKEERT